MDKNKILNHKKVKNRRTFAPNAKYLAGRYINKYKNQPIYIITDKNGKAFDVVEGKQNAETYIEGMLKSDELDKNFNQIIETEDLKTIENPTQRSKKQESILQKYKSSGDIQREEYDSAMDEYFEIDKKLQKEIDDLMKKEFMGDEVDVADIISKNPRLKNMQKNKNKAMKKAWALSQSGDEDYREEALDAFGTIPERRNYGEFTPSVSPGVREYSDAKVRRQQKIDTSFAKAEKERMDGIKKNWWRNYTPNPVNKEEIESRIPTVKSTTPKKKYSDDELLRIISGK
tara:strand:- start:146 stop:1006 length:861 start_codon:yes stop_codon:yes gene_type:complete